MGAAKPLAACLRRVTCHPGCRPAVRLADGLGAPGEGVVLARLAARADAPTQVRVAWVEHTSGPLVQLARWFTAGGDWQPMREQVSVKLYELLAVRKLLRSAHARRRATEPGGLIGERWLGRGPGRRLLAAVWGDDGAVLLRLGTSSIALDRASLCHVFDALDVAIAFGASIENSALAKLGADFDDPEYAAELAAKVANVPNKLRSMNTVQERPVGRDAAGAAPRAVQASLFGGEPEPPPKPKRQQAGPGGRIAAGFYRALDEAGIGHAEPVWARDVAQAKRLVQRVGGEAIAAELIPLAVADPWLASRTNPDFGCFLRIADGLVRKLGQHREERAEEEAAQREARARQIRVWDAYTGRYGRRHPDDDR